MVFMREEKSMGHLLLLKMFGNILSRKGPKKNIEKKSINHVMQMAAGDGHISRFVGPELEHVYSA